MKINQEKYFLGALYIGIVGLGLSIFVFSLQTIGLVQNNISSKSSIVQFKTYVNKKGEQWTVPIQKAMFTVTQAATNEGPVFLEGEIDPPDVHVGDTQWLRVIVQSPVGIKQVTAHIETDTGIKELPLNKVGTVSYRDMEPNKYIVKNGVLEILSTRQAKKLHNQKIAAEKNSFFSKASAQEGEKEKWENFWIVHDTHNTTYKTTFVVEDNAGLTNTLTLAWSDLCGIPINGDYNGGTWQLSSVGNCQISAGQLDGIERGDVQINNGGTLLIQNGGTFVFNPDYEIRIDKGQGSNITILKGNPVAQIRKTYMWYCDQDGDGRTPSGSIGTIFAQDTTPTQACGGGTGGGGFNNLLQRVVKLFKPEPTLSAEACGPTNPVWAMRRYNFVEGQPDCWEGSIHAHTGSTAWCSSHRGDGSWDYNCDLQIDNEYTTHSISCQPTYGNCYGSCSSVATGAAGLQSAVGCGQSSLWIYTCTNSGNGQCWGEPGEFGYRCCTVGTYTCNGSLPPDVSIPTGTTPRVQGCR